MKYIKLDLVLQGPLYEYTPQIVDEYFKLPLMVRQATDEFVKNF